MASKKSPVRRPAMPKPQRGRTPQRVKTENPPGGMRPKPRRRSK